MLLYDNVASESAVLSRDRPLSSVIREWMLTVREAQRLMDDRLAIIRMVYDAMISTKNKQNEHANQHGCISNEQFGLKVEGL